MSLLKAFQRIVGGWFGDVWPPVPPTPLPPKDAREHALHAFADFLGDLVFEVPEGQRVPRFIVPRESVHTHQPPNPDELVFPSIAFLPFQGAHDQYSLGPASFVEESYDPATSTVLLLFGEYVETIGLEVWGAHDATRTSLLAGITEAMRVGERSQALLLELPDYHRAICRLSLERSEHIDDPDVVRGRIRGRIYIRLEVPELRRVAAVTMKPYLRVVPKSADEE